MSEDESTPFAFFDKISCTGLSEQPIYTVSQKTWHKLLSISLPIFKILSLTGSTENLQQNDH